LNAKDDAYPQIDGDYPLDNYVFYGKLMGINGTDYANDVTIHMQKADAVELAIDITPDSPYVDEPFDIAVSAVDVNQVVVSDTSTNIAFSSNYESYTDLPQSPQIINGTYYSSNGGICSEPLTDLAITASELLYPGTGLTGTLAPITIQDLNPPAPPTSCTEPGTGVPELTDPEDNGGWIEICYTMSVDDPFYTDLKDPSHGVSYYVVERDADTTATEDWQFLASVACYDDSSGNNQRTALLNSPASDVEYDYRMASVYNPNAKVDFGKDHISYENITAKAGTQSNWQYLGGVAAADNLPAYANIELLLEGPYDNGVMTNGTTVPPESPYTGNDIGSLPSIPDRTIIDWIYVELRESISGQTVKETDAFVLDNGMIVDTQGNYSLPFYYTTDQNYYLVIHHRNHLDLITANTHQFGDFQSSATNINLTAAGNIYVGDGSGAKQLQGTAYGMYDGDVNEDELASLIDAMEIYNHRIDPPGYNIYDVTLDGFVSLVDAMQSYNNRGEFSSVPAASKGKGNANPDLDEFVSNISTNTKAKTIDLEISNPRVEGDYYKMEIVITRTNDWDGAAIGNSDFFFTYNSDAFDIDPTLDNINSNITGSDRYNLSVSKTSSKVGVYLNYDGAQTGDDWLLDLNKDYTLCTFSWEIADFAQESNITWESSTTVWTAGLFDNVEYTTYGDGDITLPVELNSFTAVFSESKNNIQIHWSTATETDVAGFNIYRSDDHSAPETRINVVLISGAGNSSEPRNYLFEDIDANTKVPYYYWLEVVNFDGSYSYHGPINYTPGDSDGDGSLDIIAKTELFAPSPNPSFGNTTIKYQLKGSTLNQAATIKVYDIRGKLVKTIQGSNGRAQLDTSNMARGIYFYRLQTSTYSNTKKLIVIK
ncbi:MAG: T9SS type A sorting domain-containing protein, partial [Candidatus Cloacimonetes bacterium]|nr:T9SS type A sorting domain-containing protein [Candidatus Cloacimonadota bacterium]